MQSVFNYKFAVSSKWTPVNELQIKMDKRQGEVLITSREFF